MGAAVAGAFAGAGAGEAVLVGAVGVCRGGASDDEGGGGGGGGACAGAAGGAAGAEDPDPAGGGGGGGGGGGLRGGGGPEEEAELPSAIAAFLSRCLVAEEQARRSSIVISIHFFSVPSGQRGAPPLGGGLKRPAGEGDGGGWFWRGWRGCGR